MTQSIIGKLLHHSSCNPDKVVYHFVQGDEMEESTLTFRELLRESYAIAMHSNLFGQKGKHALLLYGNDLSFVTAFVACQLAGVVAIPMFVPSGKRQSQRLTDILQASDAELILTTSLLKKKPAFTKILANIDERIVVTCTDDHVAQQVDMEIVEQGLQQLQPSDISFIQYTSGSTGKPKGVVVTHQNLSHNQEVIKLGFGCDETSVICSWLPFYHDMGLIGNILHAIYTGATCVLMAPLYFLQSPLRWLKIIDTYQVTHSGAPNFAFDYCVDKIDLEKSKSLNLSSWKVAYNGSEPLRVSTMNKFLDRFADNGFKPEAMQTCYGLAEATLFVSGSSVQQPPMQLSVDAALLDGGTLCEVESENSRELVSSGTISPMMDVRIYEPNTNQLLQDGGVGEICIAGNSVTEGYWNRDNTDLFVQAENGDGKKYLRTGDLGTIYDGHLFVTGRLKEMIIVRGKNYYPYDIELIVANAHSAIRPNGVAAFASINESSEALVLFVELRREAINEVSEKTIYQAIKRDVSDQIGLEIADIALMKPFSILRTSSGKIQRLKCATLYEEGNFSAFSRMSNTAASAKLQQELRAHGKQRIQESILALKQGNYSRELVARYIATLMQVQLGVAVESIDEDMSIFEIGLDSVRIIELVNTVSLHLEIAIDYKTYFSLSDLKSIIDHLETVLWLKHNEQELAIGATEITI